MREIVVFRLSNEYYGIDINKVKAIIVYSQLIITPLFHEKDHVLGVSNIRGEVIPIIDLRKKFLDTAEYKEETVVIIVSTIEDKWMGIVVDFISQIEFINDDNIKPPNVLKGIDRKYLDGFIKIEDEEMVTLLNIDLLLNIKEV